MNINNQNYLNMLLSVKKLLEENPEIVSGKPAFSRAAVRLNEKISAIGALDVKRGDRKSGVSGTKAQVKETLIALVLDIAGSLQAYASENGKPDLKIKTKITRSDLTKMRELDLVNKAQTMHDLATENSAGLADCGITRTEIESLLSLKEQFSGLKGEVGERKAVRAGGTKDLDQLFCDVKAILEEQLDRLALASKKNNPSFYNQYEKARVIVDRGGGRNGSVGVNPAPPAG